ncbi:MAG TPA: hypothetical protein PL105_03460 [Caldilineaceae bacterium]|nr:hypothetical protein [Caldilineaceae bacterium]
MPSISRTVPLSSITVAIATGGSHTCALTAAGGVKCWGSGGALGDGTTVPKSTPADVIGLGSGVAAIAAGGSHTCALTTGGGVKCWGWNHLGQLGDGTTDNRNTPVDVVGLGSGIAVIAAGGYHTCVLTTGGGIKCWGANYSGQLGDGTTVEAPPYGKSTPVDVVGLGSGITAISAGSTHTCALTTGGGVKCWGSNGVYGTLGDGTTDNRNTPVDVVGLGSGITAIRASFGHTCALTTGGGVKCWGLNYSGQLGDGTYTIRHTPVDVVGLGSGVAAIAPGDDHTCALTTGGSVKCWGNNSYGQLGVATTYQKNTPVDVPALSSGIVAISADNRHTCAQTTGGGTKCWGSNSFGQLGNGTMGNKNSPVDVVGLGSGMAAIAAGVYHTCALTTGGGAKCWGYNLFRQLGDNTDYPEAKSTPVNVVGQSSGVAALTLGYAHTCVLTTGGSAKCWGPNWRGENNVAGLGNNVAAIAAGFYHTCVLTKGGGVKCLGSNSSGQLGDGTTIDKGTPVDVVGLSSGVIAIAVGNFHNCALTTAGAVKCWGSNFSGKLGDGTIDNRNTPVDVVGLTSGVAAIAAGSGQTCALTTAGGVKCWGSSTGDGMTESSNTPVDVTGLSSGVAAITAGNATCALTTAGGVKCWGSKNTPVDVVGLGSGVAGISAGGGHTCAVTTGGGLKCWGNNLHGQLGDGAAWSTMPVDVVGLGGQVSPTTSSATLTQPPARGQLGLLGGLLAAGFAIGMALVFWGEPEAIVPVQSADEQKTDDITQA